MKLTLLSQLVASAALCLTPLASFALQALDDAELSNKTGQDGLTISVATPNSEVDFDYVSVADLDGYSVTKADGSTQANTNAGGIGLAINDVGGDQKIKLCSSNTGAATCTPASNIGTVVLDADGGAGSPYVNASFQSNVQSIYVPPFASINLLGATTSGSKPTWSTNLPVISFEDGLAIEMANPLTANLQLGNQPQGHVMIIAGNTIDVDLGSLKLLSYDDAAANASSAVTSSAQTNVSVTGFAFDAINVDLDGNDGLTLGFEGTGTENTTKIASIAMNDTVFGQSGNSNTGVFDGLQNGSIGNFSMSDIQIQNLNVNIKGL